jgi:hypothetical protein
MRDGTYEMAWPAILAAARRALHGPDATVADHDALHRSAFFAFSVISLDDCKLLH